MLQSWNKFCFTGGSIEVNVSLPGRGDVPGFWPAIWTMGNLGRAGYGATTEGTWPYTYDSCDIGVTKNQSLTNNLSWLPGQRLNKCVCKGQDHPSPGKGRAAPEIDIFEAAGVSGQLGTVSQSHQIAPFNANYNINDKYVYIYGNNTQMNSYKGAKLQQAVSAVTTVPPQFYEGKGYQTYGFEYEPGPNGYVTWLINGKPSFRLDAGAIGPDSMTKIAQRLISEEPMYVIMNLAISSGFGWVDFEHLPFPSTMRIDYVRLYQHPNRINVGCNPKDFPTSDYINKHINAYTNANLTTWAQAGYRFPTFKLDGTCPNPP
ncbi:hypothetical protein K7432_014831 [Basidiobolus ranarum]|uniref:GH16 domain-containing protein n=1 Tax=Basidiobolus ranarum TaxID=34480 RepID=A0ABR2WGY0_9FUNG